MQRKQENKNIENLMLLKGTLPFRGLVLYMTISAYVTGDDFLKTTFRGKILEQH